MKPATFSSYRDYLDLRGTCPRGWGVKLLHEQKAEKKEKDLPDEPR